MYLAADHLKKKGLDKKTEIIFLTPGTAIFGVEQVAETLNEVINRFGIRLKLFHTPVRIDGDRKLAYFTDNTPDPLLKLMLIFRSYREHWRLWILKKYGLPYLYWNKMLKGKM